MRWGLSGVVGGGEVEPESASGTVRVASYQVVDGHTAELIGEPLERVRDVTYEQ